jgi:hypothetical protein
MRFAVSVVLIVCLSSCSSESRKKFPTMTLWKIAQQDASPQKKYKLVGGSDIILTDKLPLPASISDSDIPTEPDYLHYNPGGMLSASQFQLKVRVDYERLNGSRYKVKAIYPMSEE